jgi:hypothetical protein
MKRSEEEIDKQIALAIKWEEAFKKLVANFKKSYSQSIEKGHIFDALFILLEKKYHLDRPGDLWNVDIEYDDALSILEPFDFGVLFNTIESEVDLIPAKFLTEYKVRVKANGLIWVIHKFDKDPFPSNPHAHLLNDNIKMHLGNGKCYQRGKYIHTLNKKKLMHIRDSILKKIDIELPSLEYR